MLRLVATRPANRLITDLFCARMRNASFHPANHLHRRPAQHASASQNRTLQCRTQHAPLPANDRFAGRAQHVPVPANHPSAVSSTRPHPQPPQMTCPARACTSTLTTRRARHAPAPAHHPGACPARVRTSTRTAHRAQPAPAPANHLSAPPYANTPGSPFPRPWTSSPPSTTPQ